MNTLPARTSALFIRTLRDDPKDAEIPSHRLLARAGYIYRAAAGIYSYGPLMVRVIRKVETILREELERRGATEIIMPVLQPRELWNESGRWGAYVAEGLLFHLKDRKDSDMALGPTHEEVVTDIVRRSVRSYKELPIILYQQQTKFRDEIRPRFGLMRGREFLMKDAYSFDRDAAGLDRSYQAMREVYSAAFTRMGLEHIVVEADPGAIGGSGSEEFMVVAGSGEDAILSCPRCRYAANVEKARSVLAAAPGAGEAEKPLHEEPTPNVRSVAELAAFFSLPASRMVKTLIYRASFHDREESVAVLMRGDTELHDVKLQSALGALKVRLATDDEIARATGAPQGFAGPIGLPGGVAAIADEAVASCRNFLCGVNKVDVHALDVNAGRDFPAPRAADLRRAQAGEPCVRCGAQLVESRGIEVGHVFKLGTKYSTSMAAKFADEDGSEKPFIMGCYGIGITRVAQAAVEQSHDDKGIVWPMAIAPFQAIVICPGGKDLAAREVADRIARDLAAAGVDVVLEDRDMPAGQLFKDAELLGFPLSVVAGRLLKEGKVELTTRRGGAKEAVALADVVSVVRERVDAALAGAR
ncbi:MAG: proline--tRNA ligase [Acidobacteriota bacterium]